jgi:hypothetical protein
MAKSRGLTRMAKSRDLTRMAKSVMVTYALGEEPTL